MSPLDVERIEQELHISLPQAYKDAVTNYPATAFRGNSDQNLWDNADELIRYNLELRAGDVSFVDPWPKRFFALGLDGGGCSDALDLEDPESGVYWFDKSHVSDEVSVPSPEKLSDWLKRQTDEMETYLLELGLTLVSSSEDFERAEAEEHKQQGRSCILFFIVAFLIGTVILWLTR